MWRVIICTVYSDICGEQYVAYVEVKGTMVLKMSLVRSLNTEENMDSNLPGPSSSNTTLPPPSTQTTEGNRLIVNQRGKVTLTWSNEQIIYIPLFVFLQVWKTAAPAEAVRLFMEELRRRTNHLPPLRLTLNAGDTDEERDGALIAFYKQQRQTCQWAADFRCNILGTDRHLTYSRTLNNQLPSVICNRLLVFSRSTST